MTEQALLILASLATGERHGYGVAQDVEQLSGGRVVLGAGTLYGALSRLARDGLICETREESVAGRRRRYYELTTAGRAALVSEASRVQSTAEAVAARARVAMPSRPRHA